MSVELQNSVSVSGDLDVADVVLHTIRTRRSIGKVSRECPSRALIEQVLEAATFAPNHRVTEPWRFFVLTGEARVDLGEAMVRAREAAMRRSPDTKLVNLEALRAKPLRAPVVIAVGVEPASGPKIVEVEEYWAVAAAVQNMLLAAHALGLAAMWRTGDACFAPEIKEFFGLSETGALLGFVYLGYPDVTMPERQRTPAAQFTSWLGWDDESADT